MKSLRLGILLFLLLVSHAALANDAEKTFPVRDRYVSLGELLSLAKDGDDEAQVTLGTAYAVGSSVPVDMEQAVYWWSEAGKKGNTKAQIALGTRYSVGLGVEQDTQKALYWLKEADRNGDPAAAAQLGSVYEKGSGVQQSYGEAAKWYGRAASLGDGTAQWALGEFYEKGLGVNRDVGAAKKWYAAAAAQGFGGARRDLERLSNGGQPPAAESEDLEKKMQALKGLSNVLGKLSVMQDLQSGTCSKAAEVKQKAFSGDSSSIYVLSDMYRNGWCVETNVDRFHLYLEDAARRGERGASFDLGYYYEQGKEGYSVNYNAARDWYKRAVDQGEERAMIQLGGMFLEGKGKKSAPEGVKLLERAVASDSPEIANRAAGLLALAYLPGGTLPLNPDTARGYALRAAARCDPTAMLVISLSYDQPTTLVQSYAWANLAAQRAKDKQQEQAISTRENLERRMDAASVARAQALTDSLPACAQPAPTSSKPAAGEPTFKSGLFPQH